MEQIACVKRGGGYKYIDAVILFFSIIIIANTAFFLFSDTFFLIYVGFLLLVYVNRNQVRKTDLIVFIIVILWSVINITSFLINKSVFPVITFFGYLNKLIISYLTLKIIGDDFWCRLERLILLFTKLSLLVYVLNLLFPQYFSALSNVFGSFAADTFKEKISQQGYWYAIIYTFQGTQGGGFIRNSGFMWEPGAYAMILLIGVLIRLKHLDYRVNFTVIIYIVAILTTYSTMGYVALFLLVLYVSIKTNNYFLSILFVTLLLLIGPIILRQDFILPEIDYYYQNYSNEQIYMQAHTGRFEANRFLIFYINYEKVLRLPTGYGVVPESILPKYGNEIVGVNGIGGILLHWGFIGLIVFLVTLWRFSARYFNNNKGYTTVFVFLIILFSFFSNPIEKSFIMFSVFLTPFIFKKYNKCDSRVGYT